MDTTLTASLETGTAPTGPSEQLGLVLLWSRDEPHRVGEVALLPPLRSGQWAVLGRGSSTHRPLLSFARQRPGAYEPTGPLDSRRISREQLGLCSTGGGELSLDNRGRRPLRVGDREVESARVGPGELVELQGAALLMCVRRPVDGESFARACDIDRAMASAVTSHDFGRADPQGIVGESLAAWHLRAQLRFVASRRAHVLIRGASGTGKELAARAIHALSTRANRPMVARNAATLPEGLIDAELFGNLRNYPNPGMPTRRGLVGEADGSTLFLDEFAELPESAQAHLLRVLDDGEYTPLGEARRRRADLRLLAATNRPLNRIKHDLRARLKIQIELPGLPVRREDVPLIAAHVLRRLCAGDPELARRCFPDGDLEAAPQLSCSLVETLVLCPYSTHVRELEGLLWRALMTPRSSEPLDAAGAAGASRAEMLGVRSPRPAEPDPACSPPPRVPIDPAQLRPEQIQACLDRHGGRQEPAWRELGLTSRHVLARLVRRHGLRVRGRS